MKKKLFVISCFAFCVSTISYSQFVDQFVIGAGGETFTTNAVQLNFTIGEPIIETYHGNNVRLTQGFQQSMLNITEVVEIGADGDIEVYPNPAQEYIHIEFNGTSQRNRTAQIYDLVGKKILEKIIAPDELIKRIELDHIKSGQYILIISSEIEGVLNSYKILKLN